MKESIRRSVSNPKFRVAFALSLGAELLFLAAAALVLAANLLWGFNGGMAVLFLMIGAGYALVFGYVIGAFDECQP